MSNASLGKERWVSRFNETHNYKYDYHKFEYTNCHAKIIIICHEHGEFKQTANSHYRGNGCPSCSNRPHIDNEVFIKRCKLKHGNKYGYDQIEYKTSSQKVKIYCFNHQDYFEQIAVEHANGQGCPKCAKNAKIDNDEFIKQAELVHGKTYNYLLTNYVRAHDKVDIICYEHGIFSQISQYHKTGQGCPHCAGIIAIDYETFVQKAKSIHGNKYIYDKESYTHYQNKISITCILHGSFEQRATDHINNKSGCHQCSGYAILNKNNFIDKFNEIHDSKYDYSKFIFLDSKTKSIIICTKHGEFEKDASHHYFQKAGCLECAPKANFTPENFIARMKEKFGNKFGYDRTVFTDAYDPIIIKCQKHGYYSQLARYHNEGHDCPKCSLGNKSKKEMDWLDSLNIPDEQRNVYLKKINGKLYNVDAYDSKTNTVYEFHGNYWHGNIHVKYKNEDYKFPSEKLNVITGKTFGELYWSTLEKQKILEDAGYNLIIIWEDEYDARLKP